VRQAQTENSDIVLDISQLRNITMDDNDLMREILGELLNDASEQLKKLREAIDRADGQECARIAHSAQGACGNVGAASMAVLFSSVERDSAGGDFQKCTSSLENLGIELEKLRVRAIAI
jgi:HPt (histidine-containing phosphotransfer) domain-containing protein